MWNPPCAYRKCKGQINKPIQLFMIMMCLFIFYDLIPRGQVIILYLRYCSCLFRCGIIFMFGVLLGRYLHTFFLNSLSSALYSVLFTSLSTI